jgi:phage terminase small subunit
MPAKKKAAKAPKVPKKRKLPLNERQTAYLRERVKGKNKYQAAIAAGYPPSTARVAGTQIESPHVRAEFQAIIRRRISADKIAQRIEEGLDAMETKFASFEGQLTDRQDVIAWEDRRRYAELAAKYGGYYVEKSELDMTVNDMSKRTEEELAYFVEHGVWPPAPVTEE